MRCELCRKPAAAHPQMAAAGRYVVSDGRTHADIEGLAYRCPECGRVLCGACCLPKWAALKKKTGLDGPALAARLEADPDACFLEMPQCPQCRGVVDEIMGAAASPWGRPEANSAQAIYERGETIMSARVCGPIALLISYAMWQGDSPGWAAALATAALVMIVWGYATKLPKVNHQDKDSLNG